MTVTASERLANLAKLQTECYCGHQLIMHPQGKECLWVSDYVPCGCQIFRKLPERLK